MLTDDMLFSTYAGDDSYAPDVLVLSTVIMAQLIIYYVSYQIWIYQGVLHWVIHIIVCMCIMCHIVFIDRPIIQNEYIVCHGHNQPSLWNG